METGQKYWYLDEIKRFIKKKTVAIVGNARTIFDSRYGSEIDSHDIVIRFNKGFIYYPESQGRRTDILILACLLRDDERQGYHAKYIINRSRSYRNPAHFTISTQDRMALKEKLGSQPSSGFMAIDLCLFARAKHIDLYGFAGVEAPTFYNDPNYQTQHDYNKEQEYIREYAEQGLLDIKK